MVDVGFDTNQVPEPAGAGGSDMPDAVEPPDTPEQAGEDDLALARELILKAHPRIVAELVTGGSLAEMLASVPAAEAAFARVISAVQQTSDQTVTVNGAARVVPGGGVVRSAGVNVEGLGPLAKIRAGIKPS